jgi:hypothetical protein
VLALSSYAEEAGDAEEVNHFDRCLFFVSRGNGIKNGARV